MDYKPLEKEFKSKGFLYKEVKRYPDNWCIYSQTNSSGRIINYEVFQTYVVQPYELHGNIIPAKEFWPGDNAFGFKAWSCASLEGAKRKMEEIKVRKQEPAPEIKKDFIIPNTPFTTKELALFNNISYIDSSNWIKENLGKKVKFLREQTKEEKSGRGKPAKIFTPI